MKNENPSINALGIGLAATPATTSLISNVVNSCFGENEIIVKNDDLLESLNRVNEILQSGNNQNSSNQLPPEVRPSRQERSIPNTITVNREQSSSGITTNNPNSVSVNVIESQIEEDIEPLIAPDLPNQQHSNRNESSSDNYGATINISQEEQQFYL